MKLLRLTLSNFKGIKSFTLDTQGGNVAVYGDNAVGKTTLPDAFNWLLFDKDSQGKKDFAIKTLDAAGQVMHGLSHEVEGVFDLNGRTLTLKKSYAEKWTKKRGSATKEFTGHTTDYFIDGVPAQKKEYDAFVSGIADESIFKLLTNPQYFNEQLHWQERRKILLEVCGDISDEDVIASDKSLARLPGILQGRKMEDHRKVIAARRAEINKELEKVPVRIDEATRALPDISGIDAQGLPAAIEAANGVLKKKQDELVRIQGGGEIAEKRRQLAVIEGDILRLQNEHQADQNKAIQEKYSLLSAAKGQASEAVAEQASAKRRMDAIAVEAKRLEASIKEMRDRWHEANAAQPKHVDDTTCPTCGQDLPEEMVESAREKAIARFNLNKAETLEKINAEGKRYKGQLESLMAENSDLVTRANAAKLKLQENEAEAVTMQVEIDALKDQTKPITDNPKYTQKQQEKVNIEGAIAQLQTDSETTANAVLAEIADIRRDIEALEMDLLRIKSRQAGERRIEELKAQEKILAAEYERLEGELYLCETFVKTKVSLLESRINSKFKYARFQLFEQQINGGITEVCNTLYAGVPYSSGLNNGHRGIVGLDIIATLADYYGFYPPIFYDNAESVTRLPEMKSQLITLYVSEPDKVLRVETDSKNHKEAV